MERISPPTLEWISLYNWFPTNAPNMRIVVPTGSAGAYRGAANWGAVRNRIPVLAVLCQIQDSSDSVVVNEPLQSSALRGCSVTP
jgi:hypothetical protein